MNREDELQIAVADYLRYQYPNEFWCHIANERQTSPARGAKLKKMGVRKGMPDLLIFKFKKYSPIPDGAKNFYCGLAIELKVKPNKTTISQDEALADLMYQRWMTCVCWTFDEAKDIIDDYLKQ